MITKATLKRRLNKMNIPVTPDGYVKAKHVKWALIRTKADIIPKFDLEKSENLPPVEKRNLLQLVYTAILTALGREAELGIFERAIKMIPDREVEQEWKAILDGTVSKIIKTMMKGGPQDPEDQEELAAIWEGIAGPYFNNYKGDVPEEDLEWAHKQISEYFDKVEKKLSEDGPRLSGNDQRQLKG